MKEIHYMHITRTIKSMFLYRILGNTKVRCLNYNESKTSSVLWHLRQTNLHSFRKSTALLVIPAWSWFPYCLYIHCKKADLVFVLTCMTFSSHCWNCLSNHLKTFKGWQFSMDFQKHLFSVVFIPFHRISDVAVLWSGSKK